MIGWLVMWRRSEQMERMERLGTVFEKAVPAPVMDRIRQLRAQYPGWPNEDGTAMTTMQLIRLQGIPPTPALQEALSQLHHELPESATRKMRDIQQNTADYTERQLRLAEVRDRIQATRPEGCWCLGLGGRHQVALPTAETPADGETYPMTWVEFCPCPDGAAAMATRTQYMADYEHRLQEVRMRRILGPEALGAKYERCTIASWLNRVERASSGPDYVRLMAQAEETARTLRRWLADDEHPWLYISGTFGTGKTGIVAAIARERIAAGVDARLITVPDLLSRIKDSFGVKPDDESGRPTTEQVTWGFKNYPLLILDDLGQENGTTWALSEFWQLINARYKAQLQTVITSNLTEEEMCARYREGVGQRILEDAVVIRMDEPNLRDVA